MRIDGKLDEEFYTRVAPFDAFIQTEPTAGAPATDKTEVWVAFDATNVYVAFRCWDEDPSKRVSNEMRRDNNLQVSRNDNAAFAFDTFHDRRNSVAFVVSPNGARIDGQTTAERQWNGDWNPIWVVKTSTFDKGWTVEAAMPFKSLRYRPGPSETWGFFARRMVRWRNEISHITVVPNGIGSAGLMRTSAFATLEGIDAPSMRRTLEVKPYVVGQLNTDRTLSPKVANDPDAQAGVDVKYALTQNITADLTVNTDFAQVEADEQQVNLTRFSLFFPEKREFFLENQGTFGFGGSAFIGTTSSADTPTLFYSRRVGLDAGRVVPVRVGGRVTGRAGRFELGGINIESGADALSRAEPTNFSVMRIKRDLFSKSSLGAIVTRRTGVPGRTSASTVFGMDGSLAFGKNLTAQAYWATAPTPGRESEHISYRGQLDYNADRYGVVAERLVIGRLFNPEMGFVRRPDMRKSYGQLRFSPRPASGRVRKYSVSGAGNFIENNRGQLETRQFDQDFSIEWQNSDKLQVGSSQRYEFLAVPFRIASGVTIAPGGYDFSTLRAGFNFGQQRRVFGNLALETGQFYDGHSTSLAFRSARIELGRIAVEPNISLNWVEVQAGSFTSQVIGSRITYAMTPMLFTSALIQYTTATNSVSSNVRLRWEYRPGSELFVVYNEGRDTRATGFPELTNRAVVVKINKLFRF